MSTISAMGSTLYTLYICLISTILGPGLALRGPEGSVDRAVLGLARVNRKVIQSFAFALNLFQFSILVNSFLNFHVIAAVVCALFVIYYMYTIGKYGNSLTQEFFIPPAKIVTGRFPQNEMSTQTSSDRPVPEPDLFPPISEAAVDLAPKIVKKHLRPDEYQEKEKRKADLKQKLEGAPASAEDLSHQPSHIASYMMYSQQGPIPEKDPTADGDILSKPAEGSSWITSIFGSGGGGGGGGKGRNKAKEPANGSRETAASGESSSVSVSTDHSAEADTARRKGHATTSSKGAVRSSSASTGSRPPPPPSSKRVADPKVPTTTPLVKVAAKMPV
mmetsp:Transcript_3987/g.10324  ORF Transcript_3987/g.10324 Transcript_3987/m.10324 type:complete len:332 (+) Transcript_3987:2-997(+)